MWSYALAFTVFAVVFGVMDFVWLTTTFKAVYQSSLGPLLAPKVRMVPALLFYVVYVGGVTLFVLGPSLAAGGWRQAALRGAAFGFAAYATYDLTNQATLSTWPARLTAIDLAWGVVATSIAASVSVLLIARAETALGVG